MPGWVGVTSYQACRIVNNYCRHDGIYTSTMSTRVSVPGPAPQHGIGVIAPFDLALDRELWRWTPVTGAELATRHLLELGHCRILHVDGGRAPGAAERRHGYQAAMRAAGLGRLASIIPGGRTEAEGSRAADRLIDGRDSDSATAAVVFNDQSAVGFLATLRASGISVPQQVSVVGYDDSRLARASWARLTTIGQDPTAIARAAVERAIARIAMEPAGKPVLIKPTLIERATTAPPTSGPPKAQL
jgi:DNA-binding LacI/PurR family transcriptional regulator